MMKNHQNRIAVAVLTLSLALGLPAWTGASLSAQSASPTSDQDSDQEQNLDAYIALLRTDLEKRKVHVLSQVMMFTPQEATKFWPVYEAYSKELAQLGDEKLDTIQDYAAHYESLTDPKTDELANRVLDLEGKRTTLKRKYYTKIKEALDTKTAARFLQVENQILLLLDLQIAANLPIVE